MIVFYFIKILLNTTVFISYKIFQICPFFVSYKIFQIPVFIFRFFFQIFQIWLIFVSYKIFKYDCWLFQKIIFKIRVRLLLRSVVYLKKKMLAFITEIIMTLTHTNSNNMTSREGQEILIYSFPKFICA